MNLMAMHRRMDSREVAVLKKRLARVQSALYAMLVKHGPQEFGVAELMIPDGGKVECEATEGDMVRFLAIVPESVVEQAG